MVRVIAVRKVEDCFDADIMREVEIDSEMSEEIMRRISVEASLKYYADFPRPYFRIEKDNFYTIQGVIGNKTFRVVFSKSNMQEAESYLVKQIEEGV